MALALRNTGLPHQQLGHAKIERASFILARLVSGQSRATSPTGRPQKRYHIATCDYGPGVLTAIATPDVRPRCCVMLSSSVALFLRGARPSPPAFPPGRRTSESSMPRMLRVVLLLLVLRSLTEYRRSNLGELISSSRCPVAGTGLSFVCRGCLRLRPSDHSCVPSAITRSRQFAARGIAVPVIC